MKARPILFSGPMIRALLDGRKTQTRRVVKPQPGGDPRDNGYLSDILTRRPYGKPGELLWVRETTKADYEYNDSPLLSNYAADNAPVLYPGSSKDKHGDPDFGGSRVHWWCKRDSCPSIHMPRWASRLTLVISSVRVERLQDISEADAKAEGIEEVYAHRSFEGWRDYIRSDDHGILQTECPVKSYKSLWQSINGAAAWEANPWVWVLEFKVHQCNVDDFLKARTV